MAQLEGRKAPFRGAVRFGVERANRSSTHAAQWLNLLGVEPCNALDDCEIVISAGVSGDDSLRYSSAACVIRLWDFQVGYDGNGHLASAVGGAASVIGHAEGPGVALPDEMPEKWCGVYGVILLLAELWRRRDGSLDQAPVVYDVSAADVVRAFALQNAGSEEETQRTWHRNGRVCVEHGGIFPMGFFACKDGHVAILGRSRRDWRNIRRAIGDPEWACDPRYEDPFAVARDSDDADALLEQTLAGYTRDELLARGLAEQAVIAPVYTQDEALTRGVFRPGFVDGGLPALPFVRIASATATRSSDGAAARTSCADQPLAGLRCLELCWVWSGPMVGQILADLGAEVVKVEAPKRFDLYRTRGVEILKGKMPEAERIDSSLHFHSLNRNKLGLRLDLKTPADVDRLLGLVDQSHLLIENFTVGTMERLGLGAERLLAANPSLVQVSMSGPGRNSSVEQLRSYGLVLSALGGAEAGITLGGEFLGSPTFSISDPNAAVFGTMIALANALCAHETGTGGALDVSQIEAAATISASPCAGPISMETIERSIDDHYIAVSLPAGTYASLAELKAFVRQNTLRVVESSCTAAGGHAAPLVELQDSHAAEAFQACPGTLVVQHPLTGDEALVAAPWRIDGRRPTIRRLAPRLGEHTGTILENLLGERPPRS